jgi:hypothetical protein
MSNRVSLRRIQYRLPNGRQLLLPAGADGLWTQDWSDLTLRLTVLPDASKPGFTVYRLEPGDGCNNMTCQRMHLQSESRNTFDQPSVVEFVCEGHSHRYPGELYSSIAPLWRDRLRAEARSLTRDLENQRAVASEYLKPDRSVFGQASTFFADVNRRFSGKNAPKLKDYDDLLERVRKQADLLKDCTSAQYAILHDTGVEFARIREENDDLKKNVLDRWNGAIIVAEVGQKGAEQIEAGAFWILDKYGEVLAKDPVRQFAYKLTLITMRSVGHGLGVAVDGGAFREVFHEIWNQSRQELPEALTKLLLGSLKRTFRDPKNLSAMETLATQLVSLCLYVLFTSIDFWVFDAPEIPRDERQQKFGMRMARGLSEQIVQSIQNIVVAGRVHDLPEDSIARKQVERLGSVVGTLINSTMRELLLMIEKARSEGAPFFDIFRADAAGAIVSIVKDMAAAVLEEPVKDVMRASIGQDRLHWEVFIKSLLPRSPAGQVSPEPPAIIPPEAHPRETPPKPDRTTRAEVHLVPREQRPVSVKTDSAHMGSAYTSEEIELAQRTGKIRMSTGKENGVHVLGVVVKNEDNQPIAEWYEVSHDSVAQPGALKVGHTEQQALTRLRSGKVEVGKQIIPLRPKPGWTIEMKSVTTQTSESSMAQRALASRFSETPALKSLWEQASRDLPNTKVGFATARSNFWEVVNNGTSRDAQTVRNILREAGYQLQGGSLAPMNQMEGWDNRTSREVTDRRLTIDHAGSQGATPDRTLDPENLRFMSQRDNSFRGDRYDANDHPL